jgi:hypothetical protein
MEIEERPRCVMCNKLAEFMDIKTKEALCRRCAERNEEARQKK